MFSRYSVISMLFCVSADFLVCCISPLLFFRYVVISLFCFLTMCCLLAMLSSRYSIFILCCFLSLFSSRFVFCPVYAVVFPLCLLLALLSCRYTVFPLFFSLCCLLAVLIVTLYSRCSYRYAVFSLLFSFYCLLAVLVVMLSSRTCRSPVFSFCRLLVMLSSCYAIFSSCCLHPLYSVTMR